MRHSIGELARQTGVPVKTIRYYADIGLVPEAGRTPSGYRRYDEAGLARLELVRALRSLGLDLATIHGVVERQSGLAEVARAQAEAINLLIHRLELRRAVLRAIARGATRPEEVQRMSAFARASAEDARRSVEDFLDAVFEDRKDDPFAARMRAALPQPPREPSDAQIDAWVELAALVGDPEFRGRVRQMAVEGARQRDATGLSDTDRATQDAGQAVVARAGAALAAGLRPGAPEAAPVVDALVGMFAAAAGRQVDPAYRAELAEQLTMFSDRRVERYWQLVAAVNGWPATPSLMPAYEWFLEALRAG